MKQIIETIIYNGKEYKVVIEKKRIKNCYFRFNSGVFYASCPILYPKGILLKELAKYAGKLIKEPRIDLENDSIQILGQKVTSPTHIFNILGFSLLINSEEEFFKMVKPIFEKYLQLRVFEFSKVMNVPITYKVRVQKMKTRLGSNSKQTKTLNFNLKLIHFSKEAIDSVVIHELAHYFHFDHSDNFYQVVYRYCPNYDKLNKEFKN